MRRGALGSGDRIWRPAGISDPIQVGWGVGAGGQHLCLSSFPGHSRELTQEAQAVEGKDRPTPGPLAQAAGTWWHLHQRTWGSEPWGQVRLGW